MTNERQVIELARRVFPQQNPLGLLLAVATTDDDGALQQLFYGLARAAEAQLLILLEEHREESYRGATIRWVSDLPIAGPILVDAALADASDVYRARTVSLLTWSGHPSPAHAILDLAQIKNAGPLSELAVNVLEMHFAGVGDEQLCLDALQHGDLVHAAVVALRNASPNAIPTVLDLLLPDVSSPRVQRRACESLIEIIWRHGLAPSTEVVDALTRAAATLHSGGGVRIVQSIARLGLSIGELTDAMGRVVQTASNSAVMREALDHLASVGSDAAVQQIAAAGSPPDLESWRRRAVLDALLCVLVWSGSESAALALREQSEIASDDDWTHFLHNWYPLRATRGWSLWDVRSGDEVDRAEDAMRKAGVPGV